MQTDKIICCSAPAVSYGTVLAGMDITEESVQKTREILEAVPQLEELFLNPTVPQQKKLDVIGRVFPEEMHAFLKTVCTHHRMDLLGEIFAAYDRCRDESGAHVCGCAGCGAEEGNGRFPLQEIRRRSGTDRDPSGCFPAGRLHSPCGKR